MLIARAQTQDLGRAAASTFDGDHPCALCLAARSLREGAADLVAPGKTDPVKAPTATSGKKPDLMGADLHVWRRQEGPVLKAPSGTAGRIPAGRCPQPATPPPRS
jgi:hypothetical protein